MESIKEYKEEHCNHRYDGPSIDGIVRCHWCGEPREDRSIFNDIRQCINSPEIWCRCKGTTCSKEYLEKQEPSELELFKSKLKEEIQNLKDPNANHDGVAAGYNIGLDSVIKLIDTIKS